MANHVDLSAPCRHAGTCRRRLAVKISEGSVGMTSQPTQHYHADVVIIGFGAAGGCAAIEAHDAGANVVLLEKRLCREF